MSVEKAKEARIEKLTKMLQENRNDLFAKYALGLEYLSFNKVTESLKLFKEVLAADENYLAAYYQIGLLLNSLEKEEQALVYLKKGLEIAEAQKVDNKTKNEFKSIIEDIEFL